MPNDPTLPEDPRARLVELAREIAGHKRWFQSWSMLRYAALGLITVPGDPASLARRLFEAADELKQHVGWLSGLRGDVRFCLVAALLRHDLSPARFHELLERTRTYFRDVNLPRGETQEAMATLVLMEHAPDGEPTLEQAGEVARVFEGMREHHRYLTGRDDHPAAALLASTGEPVGDVVVRLERLYESLQDLSFKRGNQLQLATHLLYFGPDPDEVLVRRFRDLYAAFQERGLRMNSGDYDEVAILAFLDRPAEEVVARVLADREVLRAELSPRPSKQEGFTMAASTAFLHLATHAPDGSRVLDAAHMAQVLSLLSTQQAASAAAAGAAAAGGATG